MNRLSGRLHLFAGLLLPYGPFAQSVPPAEYRAVVAQYRAGDATAVDRAVAFGPAPAQDAIGAAVASWAPVDLQAAAMLHTDACVALLRAERIEDGVAHVNLAARLIDKTIEASKANLPFAVRWYAFAAEVVSIHSPPWAEELQKRARARFGGQPAFASMARGRKQELIERTGGRGFSRTPTVSTYPAAFFEEAVRLDPELHEAWLHLGRLRMTGPDPAAGVAPLRRAAASPERRIHYMAMMFLGAIAERGGDFAEAERSYRDAATSYPSAQSAPLALAHLLGHAAREQEAREVLAAEFRRRPGSVVDPLWTYYLAPDELLDAVLRELRIEVMQ